jgi:uncharacterized protein (DUF1919 family)
LNEEKCKATKGMKIEFVNLFINVNFYLKYSDDKRYILKQDKKIFLLNYQYKRPNLFLICTDGNEDVAVGIDDVIFVGETRLYKVPYALKSRKFINSMVVFKGICPVPVLSLRYLKDERFI